MTGRSDALGRSVGDSSIVDLVKLVFGVKIRR